MHKQKHLYTLLILCICVISIYGYGEENSSPVFPEAEAYLKQFTSDQACLEEIQGYVQEFIHDIEKDFPFRSGMTREDIKKRVQQHNAMIHQHEQKAPESSGIPIYAKRTYHFYIYTMNSEKINSSGDGYLNFWVNGRHQFWIDMAIEQDTVKNIYLLPGNFSWMLPPLRFDGTGEYVGRWILPSPE